VSDHDKGGHHDQRRAQRNAGQQQSGHGQPPGERSHVIPYPASPSRYHPGRDLGRAARRQPRAHGQHPAIWLCAAIRLWPVVWLWPAAWGQPQGPSGSY
jgi:hypothetical protein